MRQQRIAIRTYVNYALLLFLGYGDAYGSLVQSGSSTVVVRYLFFYVGWLVGVVHFQYYLGSSLCKMLEF